MAGIDECACCLCKRRVGDSDRITQHPIVRDESTGFCNYLADSPSITSSRTGFCDYLAAPSTTSTPTSNSRNLTLSRDSLFTSTAERMCAPINSDA